MIRVGIAVLALVIAAGGVALIVTEERYQSCIARAEASTPVYVGLTQPQFESLNQSVPGSRAFGVADRQRAISRCNR